jgi:hypothetical protein
LTDSWSVLFVLLVFLIGIVLWMAHAAVHTQAKLARFNEQDGFIDALVWINRKLTGKPKHHPLTGR